MTKKQIIEFMSDVLDWDMDAADELMAKIQEYLEFNAPDMMVSERSALDEMPMAWFLDDRFTPGELAMFIMDSGVDTNCDYFLFCDSESVHGFDTPLEVIEYLLKNDEGFKDYLVEQYGERAKEWADEIV